MRFQEQFEKLKVKYDRLENFARRLWADAQALALDLGEEEEMWHAYAMEAKDLGFEVELPVPADEVIQGGES